MRLNRVELFYVFLQGLAAKATPIGKLPAGEGRPLVARVTCDKGHLQGWPLATRAACKGDYRRRSAATYAKMGMMVY
ncbi:hypothetical protein BHE74_00036637 [Ensete ventricosum]|nr:hypothetical protein GW17_00026262 [Ensete ventricosum]RWW56633.1 hypothetical protein BHE74_00036637 [Ensete ventricosum]